MANFATVTRELQAARAALSSARSNEAIFRERLRGLSAQGALSARSAGKKDKTGIAAAKTHARDLQAARDNLAAASAAVTAAMRALATAIDNARPFLDPRTSLPALQTQFPITLLPVRVETRFGAKPTDPGVTQLWVRIYPDDCWVDTFEPLLSANELSNAKQYWASFWRAGGIEADQRAAWRSLVAAHGSGRANYILDQFQPQDLPTITRANANDVILVIPTDTEPALQDRNALTDYWSVVWIADGDRAKTDAAKTALTTAIGARADALLQQYAPFNLADSPPPPLTHSDVNVRVAFVIFPPDPQVQASSWSSAPRVTHLPDCFAVVALNSGQVALSVVGRPITLPLFVGPDPQDANNTIRVDSQTGDLIIPDRLKWMVDFQAAVDAGMGVAIDLTAEQAKTGFDRLFVIGVQLTAEANDGQLALAEILNHHAMSGSGLEILTQGAPTHNTTGRGSGYSRRDDPDVSFDDRKKAPLFTVTSDAMQKRDGQILAEALGVSAATFSRIHGADRLDQREARAVQSLLWPATLGYWMDKLMAPVFSDATVENARWFFTNYVRGRGVVPAIRIGKQPYGVLPTAAFSRVTWFNRDKTGIATASGSQGDFLAKLYAFLRRVDADWTRMSAAAAYVGKAGDPHDLLLNILGLHPDSVEFYTRNAESIQMIWNLINLSGQGANLWPIFQQLLDAGAQRLRSLGYAGDPPQLLQQLFVGQASLIASLIDDRPSSESTPIRAYTDDGRNYLQWLSNAAKTSLDALQQEQGFSGNQTPQALLYLLARHALMLGYYDTSYRLYRSGGFLSGSDLAAMKPEPAFVHVDATATGSESRFAKLYAAEPRITGNPSLLVSDFITVQYENLPEAADFAAQLSALDLLQQNPTAALERLLAEHVDACCYRLDSWLLGLVAVKLEAMRSLGESKDKRQGTYLGAYALLEEVRPSITPLQPVKLPEDVAAQFPGKSPLMSDASNGGYVLAPSIPQAKTAAVLRSGYIANATSENSKTLAVNLTSDRVRLALSLLEGIRNGQSLGALLGYRFERGLHDAYGVAEVDKFIYPLRKAFPLVADNLTATQTHPDVPIEAIEARNVLDGRKLVAQIQSSGQSQYPFGVSSPALPGATPEEKSAISQEANKLLDVYDAISDLALAEGVHQAVQGNFDRLAGTLTTYSTGNFPPEPEVVQTPSNGVNVNHRVAVHFTPGRQAPENASPRAAAEPALDDWLAKVLPELKDIQCTVTWKDALSNADGNRMVSLDDLKLRPIDVVALVRPDDAQAMTELDDRIVRFVMTKAGLRPDTRPAISYLTAPADKISVFAASGLIRALRALLTRARPLRATDTLLQADVQGDPNAVARIDRARVADRITDYDALSADVGTFLANPLIQDPAGNRVQLLQQIDQLLDDAVALLERAARFNLPESGWGFILDWKRKAFADLIAAVVALVKRWDEKLEDYTAKHQAYLNLPAATPNDVRFQALRAMELVVSTTLTPLPATPAALLPLVEAKAQTFMDLRDNFEATTQTADPSFAKLLGSVEVLLPTSAFDTKSFTTTDFEDRVVTIAEDLGRSVTGHKAKLGSRLAAAQANLNAADNASETSVQTASLQEAAKAIFGDDFILFPEFELQDPQGGEWANAYAASTGGPLLEYLTGTLHLDFPIEEWLAGVARVRPAVHTWETVCNLANALNHVDLSLTPVQFPYDPSAFWVAMQYDPKYTIDSEHLLYTAQYPKAFDKSLPQCGMVFDEWTEVIPSPNRTAGLTFHYERPNSEAPQTILIVTPATFGEKWQWADLLGALSETLDLAKKRAFEPVQMSPYTDARFLPATITAATTYGITIATALTAANGVYSKIEGLS